MSYNLDGFESNFDENKRIKIESDSPSMNYLHIISRKIKFVIRYEFIKIIFFGIFAAVIFLITGDFNKSKNVADEISTETASENFSGMFNIFARETGHKSTKLNTHPVYHTKTVQILENKFLIDFGEKIRFSSLFAYCVFDDQDFLVMRKPAFGRNKEKLKRELSTIFGESANDYCEKYFDGFVPDDSQLKVFLKSWRVSKINNEVTQDNDDESGKFRCVIGPDKISEFLEDNDD